jgi:hypothetical protein
VATKQKVPKGLRREPVQTESGHTVKPLQGGDLIKLKGIVSQNFEAVQKRLSEVEMERLERQKELGPDIELPPDQGAGMAVMEVILEHAFDQAWEFLAQMVGMTVEAFNEAPADLHLEIIETLVEKDNLADFLRRYLKLRQTFSSVLPTKSSSDTGLTNGDSNS